MMDQFLTVKLIVQSYNEDKFTPYFEFNKKLVNKISYAYLALSQLKEKKYVIKSYLNKIENEKQFNSVEEYESFQDGNEIKVKDLIEKNNLFNEKILELENFLKDKQDTIESLVNFSALYEINEECVKVNFNSNECEMCMKNFSCTNTKSKYSRNKLLGSKSKLENNVIYFENGTRCHNYNRLMSAKVFIECGTHETLEFKEKIKECEYIFTYTTKLGCNNYLLKNIQDKIKLYLE